MVFDFIAHYARFTPNKLAAVDVATARRWTYAELDRDVERCTWVLESRAGKLRGERIAVLSRNSVDMLIVHFACVRTGAIFVPLNWRLAPPEIAFLLEDCTPRLLVAEESLLHLVPDSFDAPCIVISEKRNELAEAIAAAPQPNRLGVVRADDPNRPITILYSSGTTGRPKGAIVTELNAVASSLNLALGIKVTSESVFLCDPPLFHTSGLLAAARTPLFMGATVLINQKFDAQKSYDLLTDPVLGVTHYFAVPQMAMSMRQLPGFDGTRLAKLTALVTGGAPNPEAHILRWLDDGVMMANGWGMSETGSSLQQPVGDLDRIRANPASAGYPLLTTEIRIVDENGNDVPDGTVGEIWIRGMNVTPGYWQRPELNAKAFQDGWFKTGDAAFRDSEGRYTLVDRIKDMYISGGENVYPAEVEAAITELRQVAEVAVVGVPDERWGEVGCAFIVRAQGVELTESGLIEFCYSRLARYKVPKHVVFTDAIPRTASGKVQKHILREMWLSRRT